MTCLEAQSNIMAFIDKKLPDNKVNDFVKHIRHCKNCSEELEIYYTLIEGMRELDNNEQLSNNFSQDLNNELTRISNKVNNAKRFKISTFGIIFITAVISFFIFYAGCLSKAYNIEQIMKKNNQGTYYFYHEFNEYIKETDTDYILIAYEKNEPKVVTFYEKIQRYNTTKANRERIRKYFNIEETETE